MNDGMEDQCPCCRFYYPLGKKICPRCGIKVNPEDTTAEEIIEEVDKLLKAIEASEEDNISPPQGSIGLPDEAPNKGVQMSKRRGRRIVFKKLRTRQSSTIRSHPIRRVKLVCDNCGIEVPEVSPSCPKCRKPIALDSGEQESLWVQCMDTRLFICRIGSNRYIIADKIVERSHHRIGEVHSDDTGQSWKYKAILESGYVLEGICENLEDGIRCISRALWG